MGTMVWYIRTKIKMLLGKGVRKSYAQFGEDIVIDSLLRNIKKGTYVDVGAFDPVQYSNTYHFYKKGWQGLVIDPNSSLQQKFAVMRPRDTFVSIGIADKEGFLPYWEFNDGAYNTFDSEEKENYLKGNSSLRVVKTRTVALAPLRAVLQERGITSVDFLSIDAQGFDLQVLRSMGDIRPTVIAVEVVCEIQALPHNAIYLFLTSRGYTLVGVVGLTLIFKRA